MHLNALLRLICFVLVLGTASTATPCDGLRWLNTCHNFHRYGLPRLVETFQLPSGNYPNPSIPQFAYQTQVACNRSLLFQTCSSLSNVPNTIAIYDRCPIGKTDVSPIKFSNSSGSVVCKYGQDRAQIFRVEFVAGVTYYVFLQARRPQDVNGTYELLIHDYNCHYCGNPVADYDCPNTPTPGVAPSYSHDELLPETDGLTVCQISVGDVTLNGEEIATVGFEVPYNMTIYKTYLYFRALIPELSNKPPPKFHYNIDYLSLTSIGQDIAFFVRAPDQYAISSSIEPYPIRFLRGDSATVSFYLKGGLGHGLFREVRLRLYFLNNTGPYITMQRTPSLTPIIQTPTPSPPSSTIPSNRSPNLPPIPPTRARTRLVVRTPTRVRTRLGLPSPTRARTPRFSYSPRPPFCRQSRENDTLSITCPNRQLINEIVFADWGRAYGRCPSPRRNMGCSLNVRNFLVRRCVGRSSCGRVMINNQLFRADPCAGSSKFFSALWTCSPPPVRPPPRFTPPRPTYTIRSSQGDYERTRRPFVLSCNNSRESDTIVAVTSASYGTRSGCLAPSTHVLTNIRARCHLTYHSCSFRLSRRSLGFLYDPCPVTQLPRLSVIAACSLSTANLSTGLPQVFGLPDAEPSKTSSSSSSSSSSRTTERASAVRRVAASRKAAEAEYVDVTMDDDVIDEGTSSDSSSHSSRGRGRGKGSQKKRKGSKGKKERSSKKQATERVKAAAAKPKTTAAESLPSGAPTFAKEELAKYFDLPIADVATRLGVCVTILKKNCRSLGIDRWPHRKIKSLQRWEEQGKEVVRSQLPEFDHDAIRETIVRLHDTRLALMHDPNGSIRQVTCQIRRLLLLPVQNMKRNERGCDLDPNFDTDLSRSLASELYATLSAQLTQPFTS